MKFWPRNQFVSDEWLVFLVMLLCDNIPVSVSQGNRGVVINNQKLDNGSEIASYATIPSTVKVPTTKVSFFLFSPRRIDFLYLKIIFKTLGIG